MNKKTLIRKFGKPYSISLGIKLNTKKESEIFKWFLASILLGKRISEKIAIKTYKIFEKNKILTPRKILAKRWKGLVKILDEGGYARYDFSTATKLLNIMNTLLKKHGSLTELYKKSKNAEDLEKNLQEFKGIGPITTNIFLREMRAIWPKSNAKVLPIIEKTAKDLKINLKNINKKTNYFIKLECALYRFAKKTSKTKRIHYLAYFF